MISATEKGTGNSRVRAVLNMVAKQSFMEKVTFEAWERVVRMSGRNMVLAEGRTGSRALRQKCVWFV